METKMKALELDGEAQEFDSFRTFGAISEEIRTRVAPTRVLTEIYVDDRSIDLEEEEILNRKLFRDLGRVIIRTRNVGDLFRESLQLAPKICQALKLDCEDIENFFAKGDGVSAQERISEMASLMEWLLKLISGVESYGTEKLEKMTFSGGAVISTVAQMQRHLTQLYTHMTRQNWDSFRGILQNEFKREVLTWEALFSELASTWTPRPSILES